MTQITNALIEKLEAEVKAIEVNLDIYLNSPSTQVADHIDYVGTVEKQLEQLSSTKGKLVSLKNFLKKD
jgi:hypothetical protein|tara:strand:+ start:692 stop:898 length:207 start_codon:yes stop_codon:yes gene_type:complete